MIFSIGLIFSIYITFLLLPSQIVSNGLFIRTISIPIIIITILFDLDWIIIGNSNIENIVFMDGLIKYKSEIILISLISIILISFGMINKGELIIPETYFLKFSTLIGLSFLISSMDFILTIISWELFNFSLYLYVSLYSKNLATAIKYFLLSAFATSFFLFGFVILYSYTGSTSYNSIFMSINYLERLEESNFALFGCCLIFFTLFFKLGLPPLHSWAPDLYHSLPFHALIWMMLIPKLGIILFINNILNNLGPSLYSFFNFHLFEIFSCMSLIIGSISMASQFHIKRFLTYSSILNIGFILLLINNSFHMIFYSLVYFITTFIFLFILNHSSSIQFHSTFQGLFGLSNSTLFLPFTFTLFSLSGFPPFIGFYAKLLVFFNLLTHSSFHFLFLFILIFATLIAAINYLTLLNFSIKSFSFTPHSFSYNLSSIPLSFSFILTFFIGFFGLFLLHSSNLFEFLLLLPSTFGMLSFFSTLSIFSSFFFYFSVRCLTT